MKNVDSIKTNFNFPTPTRFGVGVIDELPSFLKDNNSQCPLFVTDAFLSDLPWFKKIIQNCESSQLKPVTFTDISKNPVKSNVLAGIATYKNHKCDSIIGIGGGASMDVARAVALGINNHRDLFDYEDSLDGYKLVNGEIPLFITVPTTSGTGSEVGRSAVISDDETHQKKILFAPSLMATQVFCDPALTLDLPPAITAATGMDAFIHNMEAYFAKGFHPMCDGIALEGMKLIKDSLLTAVKKPDLTSRTLMMAAALQGAVAFQKGLGIIHSTAHALSTHKDLHHGLANAIMTPACLRWSLPDLKERMSQIALYLKLPTSTAEGFMEWMNDFIGDLDIQLGLDHYGLQKEDIERLSELAFQDVCHQSHVRPVTQADFKLIYEDSFSC